MTKTERDHAHVAHANRKLAWMNHGQWKIHQTPNNEISHFIIQGTNAALCGAIVPRGIVGEAVQCRRCERLLGKELPT